EVCAAAPIAQDEGGLIDDLGTGPHGVFGGAGGGGEIPLICTDDVDDLASLSSQLGQIGGLVLCALVAEQLPVVVGYVRARADAARELELQRGEMRALDVVVQVGRRQDEATVRRLHHYRSIIATATAMTLHLGQPIQSALLRSRSLPVS